MIIQSRQKYGRQIMGNHPNFPTLFLQFLCNASFQCPLGETLRGSQISHKIFVAHVMFVIFGGLFQIENYKKNRMSIFSFFLDFELPFCKKRKENCVTINNPRLLETLSSPDFFSNKKILP